MEVTWRVEPKQLYRRLDNLFGELRPGRSQRSMLEAFLEDAFAALREDLSMRGALLYAEGSEGFELLRRVGQTPAAAAEQLEAAEPPLEALVRHGVYVFREGAASAGPCAAILVGKRPHRHALFFLLATGWVMEEVDFALNTARAALGARLTEERVRGGFRQAAEIQASLIEDPPAFPGYEIACRSLPTEEVGGDFYDFHPLGPDTLGISIGDASGHGLPAALLVRDVVTGLRMGIERELKLAHVFAKLNRVIHRSHLSSRFVSVFHAELETEGNLVYVNAGHPPPLLLSGAGRALLAEGGTVIGPLPESRYRRGIARLEPGATLVLCTDGILERRNSAGEFFGEAGLEASVRAALGGQAAAILDGVFAAALDHGDGRPWEDDTTAVVVVRRD